ncbi:L-threonylcarbamoyladenylate synthase [Halorarius halobius]|uniref:L-threonylcarbamoyladenylate synthase n=1 Tax=Halorarius halobius TaxID=2962671 RepID=UPI0020CE7C89|nr:L-threonylcarbamoyladenylate synthase [Halorarius halobius]
MDEETLDRAAEAIRDGGLVVYPTETVYGLGADVTNRHAVERVFEAKRRDRSKPVSLAVDSVAAARGVTSPTERELEFMREFLPGPVTVVVERGPGVPDVLTGGRDRVGVRIPDHEVALALLERLALPITATSANVSGRGSARRVADLDPEIRDAAAVVVDGGETPGGGSTVVDVEAGEIHRRGPLADDIEAWLQQRPE